MYMYASILFFFKIYYNLESVLYFSLAILYQWITFGFIYICTQRERKRVTLYIAYSSFKLYEKFPFHTHIVYFYFTRTNNTFTEEI